jgi:hypothetical protein
MQTPLVKVILTSVTNSEVPSDAQRSPWRPPSLGAQPADEELARHLYVVVEEKIDDVIGLLISPWPGSRDDGRLRFDPGATEVEVAVDGRELQEKLAGREIPAPTLAAAGGPDAVEALTARPAEIGDVYAVLPEGPPPAPEDLERLSGRRGALAWIERVTDITADAREAAKVATYEALTPPLKEGVADELRHEGREEAGSE